MPFINEIKNANPYIIGLMTTAQLIIQIVFSAPFGRIADKIGGKRVIYITEPLFWASTLILVFAPSPAFLILSSILGGFRMIANYVAVTPLTVARVPIECIGRWRGLLGLFSGLISIPAPIIGGIIWENINPQFLMLIPIVISIIVKIPILTTIPEKRNVMHAQKLNSVKEPTD
jgi:MFS family permease